MIRSARAMTTYWREEAAKLEDVPRPKKKPKKQHKKFTSPVTDDVEAGLQKYVEALSEEGKDLEAAKQESSSDSNAMEVEPRPSPTLRPLAPRPTAKPIDHLGAMAAAAASTNSLLNNRSGASTPPQNPPRPSSSNTSELFSTKSKILAWKLSPSLRAISYLISFPTGPAF